MGSDGTSQMTTRGLSKGIASNIFFIDAQAMKVFPPPVGTFIQICGTPAIAFWYDGTQNKSGKEARLYVYKRRYEKIEGYSAFTVVGNANDIPWTEYEGMDNCHIKDFLPAAGNFGFDMNMYIMQ